MMPQYNTARSRTTAFCLVELFNITLKVVDSVSYCYISLNNIIFTCTTHK